MGCVLFVVVAEFCGEDARSDFIVTCKALTLPMGILWDLMDEGGGHEPIRYLEYLQCM